MPGGLSLLTVFATDNDLTAPNNIVTYHLAQGAANALGNLYFEVADFFHMNV